MDCVPTNPMSLIFHAVVVEVPSSPVGYVVEGSSPLVVLLVVVIGVSSGGTFSPMISVGVLSSPPEELWVTTKTTTITTPMRTTTAAIMEPMTIHLWRRLLLLGDPSWLLPFGARAASGALSTAAGGGATGCSISSGPTIFVDRSTLASTGSSSCWIYPLHTVVLILVLDGYSFFYESSQLVRSECEGTMIMLMRTSSATGRATTKRTILIMLFLSCVSRTDNIVGVAVVG
mmetsp:Transcript_34356/g.71542  ORF Transcript_34356/g.71542 Transcript_34356/m.71542 type:complete len:231 (-) Transcript_34356:111-803(-)